MRLLKRNEVAEILNIDVASVARMEQDGTIKRVLKVPGIRYRESDIKRLVGEPTEDVEEIKAENRALKAEIKQLKATINTIMRVAIEGVGE